jgi:hypothetical protein
MFQMYLAVCGSADINVATFGQWDWENKPLSILAAFPTFVKTWKKVNPGWPTRATMLDSGAYSAYNSGKEIDFEELCQEAVLPEWTYTVGLDVIGDGVKSLENNLKMKARGLEVIPVFHGGDDWDILLEYKKHFSYIGFGGRPKIKEVRNKWLDQCFARVWPIKIHAFGCAQKDVLLKWPFYSADTASWHTAVSFGSSPSMPGRRVPRKSEAGVSVFDLRTEIHHYMKLEREVRDRWNKELTKHFGENKTA